MDITFWGVRGFIPVPGKQSMRYGGNTICVGVTCDDGTLIALDAGTGLSVWGRQLLATPLGRGAGEFNLLVTHSHYDHIQGFSFFIPALIPGNKLHVYGIDEMPDTVADVLESQMTPIFSPMQTLANFGSSINYEALPSLETVRIGDCNVSMRDLPHETSRALGVKLVGPNATVVYVPDVVYKDSQTCSSAIDFYRGADVLIHDATSSSHYRNILSDDASDDCRDAVNVAGAAGIPRIFLIHYHQDLTDDQLDKMLVAAREYARSEGYHDLEISLAQEGYTLSL